jgi:hypothetical protein
MKSRFTLLILALSLISASVNAQSNQKISPCDLKSDMRKLWEDHITWTRNVILNIIDTLPGTAEAVARLHQNQDDIGNAIKPYYGNAAGNQLAGLLHDHINIAAALLIALRDNNTAAFNAAYAQWVANADAIAALLNSVNPANWPLAEMTAMMRDHLAKTAAEAAARKNMDYAADVTAFDNVHRQILEMADMLTEGIVKQFSNKFTGCPISIAGKTTSCDLKSAMRKLWEDHIIWTRNVILNIIDTLPGTAEAVARLHQNQDDIGNAIKPYYGNTAGNQLASLLHDHINIAAALLIALRDNNTAAFNAAYAQWVANADAIAALLNSVNPANWPLAEMTAMMRDHLAKTAAEAAARKNMDYAADVTAFDNVHRQILEMADMLTEGIVKQFPNKFAGCRETITTPVMVTSNNKIDQNSPNPFTSGTTIGYFLSENVQSAQILIIDQFGTAVKRIDIKTLGAGTVRLKGSDLGTGIYSYMLVVDGRVIATKKLAHMW